MKSLLLLDLLLLLYVFTFIFDLVNYGTLFCYPNLSHMRMLNKDYMIIICETLILLTFFLVFWDHCIAVFIASQWQMLLLIHRDSSCVVLKVWSLFCFFQCSLFIVDYLGNEALHPVSLFSLFSFSSLFLHHWPFSVLGWRVRWFCWICWHISVRPHVIWHVPFGAWLTGLCD